MEEFSKRGPNRFPWRGTTGLLTANNQFQSISIQLVDLTATQSLNAREEPKSTPARVLTNEDLATGKADCTQRQ